MAYFECVNTNCRVCVFAGPNDSNNAKVCPACWHGGFRLDTAQLEDVIHALEKRVSAEQMRIAI